MCQKRKPFYSKIRFVDPTILFSYRLSAKFMDTLDLISRKYANLEGTYRMPLEGIDVSTYERIDLK